MTAISNAIRELESQLKQIQSALSVLHGLDGKGRSGSGRRAMSEAGRQRIIDAQRRRWAKFRSAKAKGASAA